MSEPTSLMRLAEARTRLAAHRSPPLVWTDTAPTQPGWYWTRDLPVTDTSYVGVDLILADEVKHPWTVTPVQWAGPVAPPQEPTP